MVRMLATFSLYGKKSFGPRRAEKSMIRFCRLCLKSGWKLSRTDRATRSIAGCRGEHHQQKKTIQSAKHCRRDNDEVLPVGFLPELKSRHDAHCDFGRRRFRKQ